jgi:hypothetical protein
MGTLSINVLERTREIGVMRAIHLADSLFPCCILVTLDAELSRVLSKWLIAENSPDAGCVLGIFVLE